MTNRSETDVPDDDAVAGSRDTGGLDVTVPDQGSTTGISESGEYVGRIAGDDPGDIGESGAERRAAADRESNRE
jgi:hypothetical protein